MTDNYIVLEDGQEIIEAIKQLRSEGGGRLYLPPSDEPFSLKVYRPSDLGKSDTEVTITSLDPNNPAQFEQICLYHTSNLNFANIEFNDKANGINHSGGAIEILSSEDIHFDNIKMESLADGWADTGDPRYGGGLIRNSDNVSITNSEIHDYSFGFSFLDSDNVLFSGNEMTGVQGDGLRIGGGTNVQILGNSFHDFYGSNQKGYTHSDVIQYWGANTYSDTVGLKIIGNYINPGVGTQGIFGHNMHGDESAIRYTFQDFEISDNLLILGSANGLVFADIEGLTVTDNTLLWNQFANAEEDGRHSQSPKPWLSLIRITEGLVDGNLVARITTGNSNTDLEFGDNHVLTQQETIDNFINAFNLAGESDFRDFLLVEGSVFDGVYGSSLTWSGAAPEGLVATMSISAVTGAAQTYSFDAGDSLYSGFNSDLLNDATFIWTFDDGSTLIGRSVEKVFAESGMQNATLTVTLEDGTSDTITRRVEVLDSVLLDIDFTEDTQDKSWYGTTVKFGGNALEYDEFGTARVHISTGNLIEFPRTETQKHLWGQDAFSLSFDIEAASPDASGYFAYAHQAFSIFSSQNGRMTVTLSTENGDAKLVTGAEVLDHDGTHRITVSYSSQGGSLQLRVDDVLVGEVEQSGTTKPMTYWPLIFGAPYNKGAFDSYIDNIKMVNYATESDAQVDHSSAYIANQVAAGGDVPSMLQDQVNSSEIIAMMDFNGTVLDHSENALDVSTRPETNFCEGVSGLALEFHGSKEDGTDISRFNKEIHKLDEFTAAMSVQMDGNSSGQILTFGQVLRVSAEGDGDILVRYWTDEKHIAIKVRDALTDNDFHRLAFTYTDEEDSFKFYVDGEMVAEREISGTTAPHSYHGIALGGAWTESMRGSLDDFLFLNTAADAKMVGEDAYAVAHDLLGRADWADALMTNADTDWLALA